MYDLKAHEKAADEISAITRKLYPYQIGDMMALPVCTELTLWGLRRFLNGKIDNLDKISIGIGGGFSGMGEVCGAVSGHILAIGVDLAAQIPDSGHLRIEIGQATRRYMRAFREKFGSVRCEDLMGMKLLGPGNWEKYSKNEKLVKQCDEQVRFGIIFPLPHEQEEKKYWCYIAK